MQLFGRAVNPVLARELTERFRGPRAAILLSVYLAVIGAIVIVVYRSQSGIGDSGPAPVTQLSQIGHSVFETTLLITSVLVLFLVPGFSAGSISGERERQTLLPLQVTLMRPRSILAGKVMSSVAFSMILIVSTMPLLALSYMIGGVRLADVATGIGVLLLTALFAGIISVSMSAWMRRVQTSTVLAYGAVLLAVVGTAAAFMIAQEIDRADGSDIVDPPSVIVAANPIVALADAVGGGPFERQQFDQFGNRVNGDGPLTAVLDAVSPDVFFDVPAAEFGRAVAFDDVAVFDQFGRPVGAEALDGMSLFTQHVLIAASVSLLCWLLALRRLRTPARVER